MSTEPPKLRFMNCVVEIQQELQDTEKTGES